MEFKTARGLVLRETKYNEADKLLTILTEEGEKLTAAAKGVLGKSGKLSAACQLLAFSEFTLARGKGSMYVKEARSLEQFLGLREDISRLALGVYMAELLELTADVDHRDGRVLSLGLNSLYALSRGLYGQEHIKSVFELRLMCLTGFEPALDCCAVCGEPEPERFSLSGGVPLCRSCGGREYGETADISPSTLDAMRYIAAAEPKRVFSFSIDEAAERELAALTENYTKIQLDRDFSTLDYWKKVK